MIKSVDDIIQSNRRVKVEDIAHSLNISVRIAHEIIHKDLGYSKVSCRWVPKMLTQEHKQKRVELSQQFLCRFEKEGDDFLKRVITCDETWVWPYEPESSYIAQALPLPISTCLGPSKSLSKEQSLPLKEIKNTVSDWHKG